MASNKSNVSRPIEDYANEGYNLLGALFLSSLRWGIFPEGEEDETQMLSRVDDATLYNAVRDVRSGDDEVPGIILRTIEDRFAPDSLQSMKGDDAKNMTTWMEANPKAVARNKAVVETINTTEDMPAFRAAMNELFVGIGIDKVAFTIAPSDEIGGNNPPPRGRKPAGPELGG